MPSRLDLEFWGWGRNDCGQLGIPDDNLQLKPVHLEDLDHKDVVHVAGNSTFNTAAVTDDGEVFMMGMNDVGQMGMKTKEMQKVPKRVGSLDAYRITHVALGSGHVVAITEQGSLLAWGNNEHGQLGCLTERAFTSTPKPVKLDKKLHFVRVAAGSGHSLALTSNGRVYSCGQGDFGALGHDNINSLGAFTFIQTLTGLGVTQVACGEYHSVALTIDGYLWSWGRGRHGQLGHGDREARVRPFQILSLKEHHIKQVSCGDSHSLCCDNSGHVFAWGQSKWGQTGTGSTEDILSPVQIDQLREEYIIQVACGSRHSLALARRGAVFAFGNGELGQLGNEEVTEFSPFPAAVMQLPSLPVVCIIAGGDHSIVMFRKSLSQHDLNLDTGRYGQGVMPFKVMNLFILLGAVDKLKHSSTEIPADTFFRVLEDVFSCPGFLLKNFSELDRSSDDRRLKIKSIIQSYERIFRFYDKKVIVLVGDACVSALKLMLEFVTHQRAPGVLAPEYEERLYLWVRVCIILMLNPVFGEVLEPGGRMVHRIAHLLQYFTPSSRDLAESLILELPVEVFGGRLVNGVHKHLNNLAKNTHSLENPIEGEKKTTILTSCKLLHFLYMVNERGGEKVAFEKFYNQPVSDGFELGKEYLIWKHTLSNPQTIHRIQSICQLPFILTPEAKANIIQGEAMIMKSMAAQQSALGALFHGIHPGMVSFLDINIRRDHIREDAMNQLVHRGSDLQKPLRVKFFSNGVEEEGQDEGGLSKEFFQLLVEEIFNVDFGMFVYNEETRDFWFSHQALEADDFRLVGLILGLAIYNTVILDVHFPLVVYKKLKGLGTTLEDLKGAFPQLGKGLQQLLDFDGDVENTFFRTFEVEYEYFGEMMTSELKPGGASIPVTAENRQEYVDLYTKYILEDSIKEQFQGFKQGFEQVCTGDALKLYRYEELDVLVCGLPHLDFQGLEKVARYDGGYTSDHPTVRHLWSVIHELPLADKKKFLSFVTGCDRAPVGGLSKLSLLIQRSGPDSDRLPTSHTCFNILLLPDYSSREKLAERMMVAIQNAQGFGLQ